MKIFITAGNTMAPIDKVRAITNIFTGRTGASIAQEAWKRGHKVLLLTSHPEVVSFPDGPEPPEHFTLQKYRTFEDLHQAMAQRISSEQWDAIIHCAAVSDYRVNGIYAPENGTTFDTEQSQWQAAGPPTLRDCSAGKVKSNEEELWLRLVRTPKLVDLIRSEWHFQKILVKFKLEVGIEEETLLEIAEKSRQDSQADLMVANTLEGAPYWAYLGPLSHGYERLARKHLAGRLIEEVEKRAA